MVVVNRADGPVIRFGDPGADHVSIRAIGWLHPEADDYWDGNWLISPIEVASGGFRAEIGAGLRVDELVRFRQALEKLYLTLRGEAVLESMEGWIQLHVAADGRGGLQVTGTAIDRPGGANTLAFTIGGLDQTHLPVVISALAGAEARFPLRGQQDP